MRGRGTSYLLQFGRHPDLPEFHAFVAHVIHPVYQVEDTLLDSLAHKGLPL